MPSDKDVAAAKRRRKRQRNLEAIALLKANPCARCKTVWPACVMDFHHRDRSTKRFDIGSNMHRTWNVLFAEIQKCDLLCANCHRITEAECAF